MNGQKPSRRGFFGMAGGLAGGIATASAAPTAAVAYEGGGEAVPFYGPRQAGITTPMQSHIYFAAFDLAAENRQELVALLQAWTMASARMSAGLPAVPGEQDGDKPSLDSGEAVGLNPQRLTITFGFGPDLFTLAGKDRYGLAAKRPEALVNLPGFNGDQLVEGLCGGALCVQACADDAQVAFHAVRQLARLSYGAANLRWVQSGFCTGGKSKGTARNLLGFKDGTMNPTGATMDQAVWVEQPGWMQGGSYMVARRIRIALEHWDRMRVGFQEMTFGRSKATGAPLGGKAEFDTPDFNATDSSGNYVIPENAHMRLAAPVNNDGAQILRRSYSYNDGANFVAERWPPWHQGIEYDAGLFFQAYQKDPRTGFIRIFDKMSKFDALNQFTTHVGSAIFACPPGVTKGGYIGQGLLETA
ncbi:MAG TPA: iron uptake transporter deferrochelatase/peroxidase subunit [Acidocella sp.]|jgi:deferrochelatase/peroxidase EfeB|nr:iron uptake transporter deferrochelatase/peroxidase subunit [Acidocella sp.]